MLGLIVYTIDWALDILFYFAFFPFFKITMLTNYLFKGPTTVAPNDDERGSSL